MIFTYIIMKSTWILLYNYIHNCNQKLSKYKWVSQLYIITAYKYSTRTCIKDGGDYLNAPLFNMHVKVNKSTLCIDSTACSPFFECFNMLMLMAVFTSSSAHPTNIQRIKSQGVLWKSLEFLCGPIFWNHRLAAHEIIVSGFVDVVMW